MEDYNSILKRGTKGKFLTVSMKNEVNRLDVLVFNTVSYNLSISFMVSVINFLFFCNSWSSLFVPFVSYIWQSATLFLFVYFLCLWDIVWCICWFSVFVWDSFLCFFCLNVYISFWFSASKELTLFHVLR